MSIRSMTGYARESFSVGETDFTVEISSVNQRGLVISVAAPQDWLPAVERLISPIVRDFATRGKITVNLRTGTPSGAHACDVFSWDEEAAAATLRKMEAAAKRAGTEFLPTPETFLRIAELHRTRQAALPSLEDENVSAAVASAVSAAMKNFVAMRECEGSNLEKDLRERLARLRSWVEKIREASAGTVENQRDALRSRLAALGVEIDLDDPRFLKEIAIFADRCDISEEQTRLASHFAQFENCLGEPDSGRKLDFICQEILRELNTIGSKANNAAITRCVVEAKNEQERLREQVQNIE
ncbi:MAG: YicC family protein [Opitutales bacterium]|nr:YicC family protein [Opitutales bacterium]